jgi:A/G-specific adenine glycosylase
MGKESGLERQNVLTKQNIRVASFLSREYGKDTIITTQGPIPCDRNHAWGQTFGLYRRKKDGIQQCFRWMKKSRRDPEKFRENLTAWYAAHHRKLPWRETKDPYRIWISEVMLQQTIVQTVIPRYLCWIKLFPDVTTLSRAPLRSVLKAWEGLGYYQRARNIHMASKIIKEHHQSRIPRKHDILQNLPGFGPYTTAAVLSIAYGQPYPAIDANVRRVLMRILKKNDKASPKIDRELLSCFSPLLPRKNMGDFNQAMMELGALVCRPHNPLCNLCPVSDFCLAFEAGEQEVIPRPKKRNYQRIEAAVGLIEKRGKFLVQKRPSKGLLADLWEFPGGKIKKGESPRKALRREIKEELGASICNEKRLVTVRHAYTRFQVTLHAFSCSLQGDLLPDRKRLRWVSLQAMKRYPFPSGSAKIIKFLEKKTAS